MAPVANQLLDVVGSDSELLEDFDRVPTTRFCGCTDLRHLVVDQDAGTHGRDWPFDKV